MIHDTVRLRGSSKRSGTELNSGPGHKERCTSPANVDRPWNLSSWTTNAYHTHYDIDVQAGRSIEALISRDKLRRNFGVPRQTTQKPWCPVINNTEDLISKDKLHTSIYIQSQNTQKPWYPKTNYTETLMSRDKQHRNLDVQRQTTQKSWYPEISTEKPWCPETNCTEALISSDKQHRRLDIQRQTTHNP